MVHPNTRISPLGGGIHGFIPKALITTNNNNNFAKTRFLLKNGWNTNNAKKVNNHQSATTPFRAINNAGDLLSRQNYSCGGPTQSFQSRPGMHGLKNAFGHISSRCDNSGAEAASCNVKYVYDSSDVIRYKKQKAINKNYNDLSYGGNQYSGAQSAIRAIRRY
jgi:hypothetical protein|tara:strand:+ start:1065 stop:1553 length:489 start_codon:yes stop_codon:yes gene_type:complete